MEECCHATKMDGTTWWVGEGGLGKTRARKTANMPYTSAPSQQTLIGSNCLCARDICNAFL